MVLVILVGASVVLFGAGYAWAKIRQAAPRELHFSCCPRCDKGLRYPAERAGQTVTCPACKRPVTLPRSLQAGPGASRVAVGYRLRRLSGSPAR
jgi:hypothetical protein